MLNFKFLLCSPSSSYVHLIKSFIYTSKYVAIVLENRKIDTEISGRFNFYIHAYKLWIQHYVYCRSCQNIDIEESTFRYCMSMHGANITLNAYLRLSVICENFLVVLFPFSLLILYRSLILFLLFSHNPFPFLHPFSISLLIISGTQEDLKNTCDVVKIHHFRS